MKKLAEMKRLSRDEMKNVTGGAKSMGVCDNWWNQGEIICINCCMAYMASQPASVDPDFDLDYCEGICYL